MNERSEFGKLPTTPHEEFLMTLGVPQEDARRLGAGIGLNLNSQIEERLKKIFPQAKNIPPQGK